MKNLAQWALKALRNLAVVVALVTAIVTILPVTIVRAVCVGVVTAWEALIN